jgi:hypothetical protein
MERANCLIESSVSKHATLNVERAGSHLPFSPLVGEMPGRAEGGITKNKRTHRPQSLNKITEEGSNDSQTRSSHCATRSLSAARRELTLLTAITVPVSSLMR